MIRDYGGEVKGDREEMMKMKGVGRKKENVVIKMDLGKKKMEVEKNILRIGKRIGIEKGKKKEEVEEIMVRVIKSEYMIKENNWMIMKGRYV